MYGFNKTPTSSPTSSTNLNTNLDKVKIVVVGDSGVGKTSLVHLITRQEVLKKPAWTIGCSVDAKLHEFKDGTVQQRTHFIELYDIGGKSAHRPYAKIFYGNVDGIILVHDLTNRKSKENLKHWLIDVIDQNENMSIPSHDLGATFASTTNGPSLSPTSQSLMASYEYLNMPPLFVVGTKFDEAKMVRNSNELSRSSSIGLNLRTEEINLDCMQPKYLAPASSNSIKLAKFFDKVIEFKSIRKNKEVMRLNEKRNSGNLVINSNETGVNNNGNFISIQIEGKNNSTSNYYSNESRSNLISRANPSGSNTGSSNPLYFKKFG